MTEMNLFQFMAKVTLCPSARAWATLSLEPTGISGLTNSGKEGSRPPLCDGAWVWVWAKPMQSLSYFQHLSCESSNARRGKVGYQQSRSTRLHSAL